MTSRHATLLGLALAIVGSGCGNRDGHYVEDVRLQSESPLITPLSHKPVCALGLDVRSHRRTTGRSSGSSYDRARPRFAPGLHVQMGDRLLPVVGHGGDPAPLATGERWSWDGKTPAPDELFGHGSDSSLRCVQRNTKYECLSLTSVYAVERFVRCDEPITLRGFVTPKGFVLLDPAEEQADTVALLLSWFTSAAFVIFGGLMAGMMVVTWLGFWVWSRTGRRRKP